MILIAQNTVNKTLIDFFTALVYVHIFYYFSIYWSDTSLPTPLPISNTTGNSLKVILHCCGFQKT